MARKKAMNNQEALFDFEKHEIEQIVGTSQEEHNVGEPSGLLGGAGTQREDSEREATVRFGVGRQQGTLEEHRGRMAPARDAGAAIRGTRSHRTSNRVEDSAGTPHRDGVLRHDGEALLDGLDAGREPERTRSDRQSGLGGTDTGADHGRAATDRTDRSDRDGLDGRERSSDVAGNRRTGDLLTEQGNLFGTRGDRRLTLPVELDETGARTGVPVTFVPGTDLLVPTTAKARFQANLAVLDLLETLESEHRYATAAEQLVLSSWSSWGAIPEVFDPSHEAWAKEREELRQRLNAQEWDAARVTTLNAHYTEPKIAKAMWTALEGAGFVDGVVIEPGCGAGTFIGQAPPTATMLGVELDPVTARIASHLYPEAIVHGYGYEKLMMPEGVASAAIGNVPFGNFRVHDPRHNSAKLNIHNHFIAKSLRMVAPGGYVAMITSSYTMDASTSTARREIAKYGDLVSAVRLPSGAFKEVAGTDVLTDVLVFRRREANAKVDESRIDAWVETGTLAVDSHELTTNQWYIDNPSAILGEVKARSNQFGQQVMEVAGSGITSERLGTRLNTDIALASQNGLGYAPVLKVIPATALTELKTPGLHIEPAHADAVIGHVRLTAKRQGLESYGVDGLWESVKIPKTGQKERLAEYGDLIAIKDVARELIDAQRSGNLDVEERGALRQSLLNRYESYSAEYGPINRFTLAAGRKPPQSVIDKKLKAAETEWRRDLDSDLSPAERRDTDVPDEIRDQWLTNALEVEDVRVQEHTVALRSDPDFGLLMSVERFDEETGEARPSALCLEDILGTTASVRQAESPADALAICLDESRSVDLVRIGELLDLNETEARDALGELVFEDPRTNDLVPAVHYLSGDVLSKLDAAHDAVAAGQLHFESNISALEGVKRRKVEHFEINTKPGGYWIDPQDYADFCLETFKSTVQVEQNPLTDTWALTGPALSKFAADVQFAFGVGKKKTPVWVLEQLMNNRSLKITKTIDVETASGWVKRSVEDTKATAVARAKGTALTDAFAKWLYVDDSRRDRVVEKYNRMFNSYVSPDYKSLAGHMSLPGVAERFIPHHYQREAVARIVNEPTVLLDHVVGAGKTGTMVMGAMELRRTGIARKPWVVVPNHLVDQISREFKEWYPASSVLAMPTGADEEARRRYVAASATGDWDAVIVPFSTFEKISVDPVKTRAWIEEETSELRKSLEARKASGEKSRITVKTIEAAIKKLEVRHEAITSNKDAGLTFEDSGCDYLFVDEAHGFKNLRRSSDFQELAHTGSNRASDLDYKLRSLRESKTDQAVSEGRDTTDYLPAVATFATGTPVANSLAEMWVMQHYLRPDLLEKASLKTVDAWGNQFTKSATKIELSPSGSEYKARERLSKFVNVPELLAMTNQFTSSVTTEDITAKLPTLVDGKRTPMVRPASDHVLEYVAELAERAENLPSDPSIDNLLKITNDGRSVALDPRLAGLEADPDGGRVAQVSEQILRIHRNTNEATYKNTFDEVEPLQGGLQLVFADRAIPNNEGRFSIYDAITDDLVVGGIPREEIAFIHDTESDADKAALFDRCRNGKVRVLFGSTERMGTGTNVQKRAVALHHVDIPWRPADLEQREGRIIRQGNQTESVEILNYVTEGTFDVYMWQTVTRKAEFIAQIKHANIDARTVDDISSDFALMAAEMKALATGNPELIEYSQLTSDIHTLEVLERAHWDAMAMLKIERQGIKQELNVVREVVQSIEMSLGKAKDTSGEKFIMRIGDVETRERDTAGRALTHAMGSLVAKARMNEDFRSKALAQIGGFTVSAQWSGRSMTIGLHGVKGVSRTWTEEVWSRTGAGHGLVTRLENLVSALPDEHRSQLQKVAERTERLSQLEAMDLDAPYGEATALAQKRVEADLLRDKLGMPEIGSADEIETVVEPMVMFAELPSFMRQQRLQSNDLCVGDILEVKSGKPKGTFEFLGEEASTGKYLMMPIDAGDEHTEPVNIGYSLPDKTELVSRRLDALTPVELAAYELPLTDQIASRVDDLVVGDLVTVQGTVANKKEDVQGTLIERRQIAVPYGYPKFDLDIQTDDGIVTVHLAGQNLAIVRHNVLDPAAEALKAVQAAEAEHERRKLVTNFSLLPGDVLLEDAQGLGLRGDVFMPKFREEAYRAETSFRDPATGEPREVHGSYEPRALDIKPGRELSSEEIGMLYSRPTEFSIADLRRGDRVLSTDLDPKATIAEEIHVLNIGYGPRHSIEYRPVDAPWENPRTVNRMENQEVSLLGRRYGALDDLEFSILQNPGQVEGSRLKDIDDSLVGSWVEFKGYIQPPKNAWMRSDENTAFVRGRLMETEVNEIRSSARGTTPYYTLTIETEGQKQTLGSYDAGKTVTVFSSSGAPYPSDYRGMELVDPVVEEFSEFDVPALDYELETLTNVELEGFQSEPVAETGIEEIHTSTEESSISGSAAAPATAELGEALSNDIQPVVSLDQEAGIYDIPRLDDEINVASAEEKPIPEPLGDGLPDSIDTSEIKTVIEERTVQPAETPTKTEPNVHTARTVVPSLEHSEYSTVLTGISDDLVLAELLEESGWQRASDNSVWYLPDEISQTDKNARVHKIQEYFERVHLELVTKTHGMDSYLYSGALPIRAVAMVNLMELQPLGLDLDALRNAWVPSLPVSVVRHDVDGFVGEVIISDQIWTLKFPLSEIPVEVVGPETITAFSLQHTEGPLAATLDAVFHSQPDVTEPEHVIDVAETEAVVEDVAPEVETLDDSRTAVEEPDAEGVISSEPVFAAGVPSIDRERDRRIMIAAHVLPGAVLVADSGARVAVLSSERTNGDNVALVITNADSPGKTKTLEVSGWKKFSVEPLPMHLGSDNKFAAKELGPQNNYQQVWWDAKSHDAGYVLGMVGPVSNNQVELFVHDGKGSAFSVKMDANTQLSTRTIEPPAKTAEQDPALDMSIVGSADHGHSMS